MRGAHLTLLLYVMAIWRRRWLALAVAWVVCSLGWTVVLVLPDQYTSTTRIYADTESMLGPLLRNIAVESDMQRQLEVMQRTLLSRNNIAQVTRSTDLDLKATTPIEQEELYERLQKKISVSLESRNLFLVSYTDKDPVVAKNVVQALLTIFVESNLGQNRTDMENARSFIEKQIAEYEQQLKTSEQRLAEFKTKNINILSGSSNYSVRMDQARSEYNAAKIKYEDAVTQREQLRSNLAGVPEYVDIETPPQVVIGGGPEKSQAQSKVEQLEAELTALRARFTEAHPDVISAKDTLEQYKAQVKAEDVAQAKAGGRPRSSTGGASRGRVSNQVYEQLKLRLVDAESAAAMAKARMEQAGEDVKRLTEQAEVAPRIEAELADLMREYGVLRQKYEELLSRRESARISQAAESSSDKVQFRIIDAPQVAPKPTAPNRPLLLAAVLALGVGAGVGLAFLLHQLDDAISDPEDVSETFHVPLLGTVSMVDNLTLQQQRRVSARRFVLISSSLLMAFGSVMALSLYMPKLHQMIAKGALPSFIERIVQHVG